MRTVLAIIAGLVLTACAPQSSDAPDAPIAPPPTGDVPAAPVPPAVPEPADVPGEIQDIDFTSYSRDMAGFVGLDLGEMKANSHAKIQTYFKPKKGAEGNAEYNFIEFGGVGGNVILASASGLADDSVKAEELIAVFKDDKLVDYGIKIKCWRGETPDEWQTEPCP